MVFRITCFFINGEEVRASLSTKMDTFRYKVLSENQIENKIP